MNPKVSIIIPTYNNLKNLRLCINSIKNQTFSNYEVWIIDGASTDKTTTFLETLKAPFFWKSEKDNGIYDAMNKGISFAKGEWLYFLGADDEIAKNTTLKDIFDKKISGKISIISGKVSYKEGSNPFIYNKKNNTKTPSWSFLMWIRNGLHHQGTFYKKELISTQMYTVSYKILADYALNLQLYKKNNTCFLIEDIIAKCSAEGVSKKGGWEIYKEEIILKSKNSSKIFFPLFYLISVTKYVLKKRIDGKK